MVCCRPKRAEVATDKAGVCTILLDVPPQSSPPANCSPYLQGNLNSNICIKEHLCYKIKDRSRLLKTGKTRKSILRQASDSLDCIKTNNVWEKKHLTKKNKSGWNTIFSYTLYGLQTWGQDFKATLTPESPNNLKVQHFLERYIMVCD